jgi:hypothetical protein
MFIGFNIDRANEAMEGVNGAYSEVTNEISARWDEFVNALRNEWVGPDEQDFEKKLKARLESLERAMKSLASDTVNIFDELAQSWAKFQDSNTISGDSTGAAAELIRHLRKPTITNPAVLNFAARMFDSSTNFGLTNANAADSLRGSLESFVASVRSRTESLFSQIDTNAAFYGENQAAKLQMLKDKVGAAVATVATSIKDLDDAMAVLVGGYNTADSTIAEAVETASGNVESSVETATEGTRWTSGGGGSSTGLGGGTPSSNFSQTHM